jgi:putative oxidoreductase
MDYTEVLFLIGRILFGGYFIMGGMNHFTKREMMNQYALGKGVGGGLVAFSGLIILLGGLGILLGAFIGWSALLLAVFLIIVSFKMHAFWKETDPKTKMENMRYFMANMALLGATLMMLVINAPWTYSVGGY